MKITISVPKVKPHRRMPPPPRIQTPKTIYIRSKAKEELRKLLKG